ncbi:MAG: CHAT domain-containing protein [Pirellulales bacterium]|nr:CHAT domain-containing protein [Pirellulales bacterium]
MRLTCRTSWYAACRCLAVGLCWSLCCPAQPALAQRAQPQLTAAQQARLKEAERLNQQVIKLHEQGKPGEAIAFAKQELAIRKEVYGLRHRTTGTALNNLGYMLFSQADYAAARPYLEQALSVWRDLLGAEHGDVAVALNNLGLLCQAEGDFAAARSNFEQALKINLKAFGEKAKPTATTLNNLGRVLEAQGDLAPARRYLQRALAVREALLGEQHPETATTLNNLGMLLYSQGDSAAALPLLQRSLAARKVVLGAKHPDTAISLNNLGSLYRSQGDLAKARSNYAEALAIWELVYGKQHPMTAAALSNLAGVMHAQGDLDGARRRFEEVLEIQRQIAGPRHPDVAIALTGLALLDWDQANYAAARPRYEQALAIWQTTLGVDHPDTATAHLQLASTDAAEGKWLPAAIHLDAARRGMRRHIARVLPGLSEREQLLFLRGIDASALHVALSLGYHQPDVAEIGEYTASWLLNGKALSQQAIAQRMLLSRASKNPQQAKVVRQLQQVRQQLARLVLTIPSPRDEAAHRQRQSGLEQQEQDLSRRLAQFQRRSAHSDPWVELDQARAALPADAVFIDIARISVRKSRADESNSRWLPERYLAWIVPPAGKGKIRIVDLGRADAVDRAVEVVRVAMTSATGARQQRGAIQSEGELRAEQSYRKQAEDLATLVLKPLLPAIGDVRQWVLSPDSALWLVPWGALPIAEDRYVIEDHPLRFVVSGRDLVAAAAEVDKTNSPVVLADPDYDLNPADVAAATLAVLRRPPTASGQADQISGKSSLPRVSRLPGTAAEAKAIAPRLAIYAAAEPVMYTGKYALEGVFKAVERPQSLVVSTHGYFLADQAITPEYPAAGTTAARSGAAIENPLLRCGLLLAGCNQRGGESATVEDDGALTGMEIVGSDLNGTRLVVLSACETGVGKVQNGEGVAGLRQAFQLAGAQAVVATLWQIPDQPSAQLMSEFFTRLAEGKPAVEALQAAQLTMIESRRKQFGAAHPYFWAAFTLTE